MRYDIHWGHTVPSRTGRVKVTRSEYNRNAGVEPPEPPEMPDCAVHAWAAWTRLNSRRSQGEDIVPISDPLMESFERMTGTILTPEDVQMIEAIDSAFISQVNIERKDMHERIREESKNDSKRRR